MSTQMMIFRFLSRRVLPALAALMPVAACAQVGDAFKGFYPEVEPACTMSLNGSWKLRVVSGISDADSRDFALPAFDDSRWQTIPVPGNWEIYGFSKARYDTTDSLTGYYRTAFILPQAWQSRRVVLRMDGVLRAYTLYVNGSEAGSWQSSYNTCLFDITPYLHRGGKQTLALRVVSRFKGFEFDTYDDWAPMGIFRNVSLLSVPDTHLSDFTVTTTDIARGDADVKFSFCASAATSPLPRGLVVRAAVTDGQGRSAARFSLPLDGKGAGSKVVSIGNAQLWTAETPSLYRVDFQLMQGRQVLQRFSRHFGIRQLAIDGKVVKINGQPVKLRGVTLHATDPYHGKVVSDSLTLRDMRLMKEASVNYIRCSHYAREPRFYELCDSLGFYVIDEVSFGYGDSHLRDSTYRDILLTHADATVRRDRNHPSVIIWSIGNENPMTKITGEVGQYVLRLDPSRQICYPQVGSYFHSLHYQMPAYVGIFAPHYPVVARLKEWAAQSPRPIILTEYCHSLGLSFEDHDRLWNVIQSSDVIAGGSVWEWVDQAMPFSRKLTSRYGYDEDVYTSENGGFTMCGNKGTDGLLYADRTPLPNYYELQRNYARAFVTDSSCVVDANGGTIPVRVANRYDFINLKGNVNVSWALCADLDTLQRGMFSPDCAPRHTAICQLDIHALPAKYHQNTLLTLHFAMTDRDGFTFLRQTLRVNAADIQQRLLAARLGKGDPREFLQGGFMMRTGRKLSMGERLKVKDDVSKCYLQPVSSGLTVDSVPGGWHVSYHFAKALMPRIILEGGVAMLLRGDVCRVQWIGNGPYATYPGKQNADRYGLHTMSAGDLYFEGNRMGVDAALLTNDRGEGLLLVCGNAAGVNFEQTDRGIVLSANALVSGLGPKFAKTAHAVEQQDVTGSFYLMRVDAANGLDGLFVKPSLVKPAQNHFLTQYDNYLMKFADIFGQ